MTDPGAEAVAREVEAAAAPIARSLRSGDVATAIEILCWRGQGWRGADPAGRGRRDGLAEIGVQEAAEEGPDLGGQLGFQLLAGHGAIPRTPRADSHLRASLAATCAGLPSIASISPARSN